MKIISIFLVLCLINASIAGWFGDDDDSTTTAEEQQTESGTEAAELSADRDRLQSNEPDNPDSLSNKGDQDDRAEGSTVEPSAFGGQANPGPVDPSMVNLYPANPNPVNLQNQVSAEKFPEPDYRAVNMRDHIPQCHNGQYQCQKADPYQQQVRCIPHEWRCNGLRDCELNDDENNCSPEQLARGRTQTKCNSDQYQCHGTGINSVPPQCIDRRQVCDGTYQCSYGDDEANCAERRDQRREPNTYDQSQDQRRPDTSSESNAQRPHGSRDGHRPNVGPVSPYERKSDEYVQRLEWRDRCFRSCLKY